MTKHELIVVNQVIVVGALVCVILLAMCVLVVDYRQRKHEKRHREGRY